MRRKLLSSGLHGQSDSIWIKLSRLSINIMADRASHKASSPLLNIEGRLEAYWFGPFPPNCQKMVSTHLEIDGHALQWGSWALDLKRSFKPITHGARNAVSSSLLPIPSGFEKWSIIHLSGK